MKRVNQLVLSYYRYIAAHTVTDCRYIQNKLLVVHVRPGDNWTTATCTAHPNTTLSIYRYIAAHTVTDSKYIQNKILVVQIRLGDTRSSSICTAHSKTNLSMYRNIALHTVTDSRYIQNNTLFVHVRKGKKWQLLHALPIRTKFYRSTDISQHTELPTVGIYRTKSWFSTSDRAISEQLLHALPFQTTLSIYRYIATHKVTDSRYTHMKILVVHEERATSEQLLHALSIQTKLYQSTDT